VKEIFMVREPLSRMVSIYYFWGELFKMEQSVRGHRRPERMDRLENNRQLLASPSSRRRPLLGATDWNKTVVGPLFTYHGQETTPPPTDIAMAFAHKFPLRRGFPGPSLSTSAFAGNPHDALNYMRNNEKMVTIVLERLDESLVVLRHFLGWSLADVVVTQPRKALSGHPKIKDWPQGAAQIMKAKLMNANEYEVYDTAHHQLNNRIKDLETKGVNVTGEVMLLKAIRHRVRNVRIPANCL